MRMIIIASPLGMGQEVKKTGIGNEAKKEDKKAAKAGDDKDKEGKK